MVSGKSKGVLGICKKKHPYSLNPVAQRGADKWGVKDGAMPLF